MRHNAKTTRAMALSGLLLLSTAFFEPAQAETMFGALAKAYVANPTLNAQRASLRATDENLPQALAGYRPTVNASGSASAIHKESRTPGAHKTNQKAYPSSLGLQLNQNIFNGNRTSSSVGAAKAQIMSDREQLRNIEQSILLNSVAAYMNVLRDTAVLRLQRNNVEVLIEQLRQTQTRFSVGEVTQTDVAQSEAQLASSRAQESIAEASLQSSLATYRQYIGEAPHKLSPGTSAEKYLPQKLEEAIRIGLAGHPAIIAASHGVDVADFQVKVAEGALYPQLDISAGVSRDFNASGINRSVMTTGTVTGQLRIPLYEGGLAYAQTRQAKEQAGQRRLQVDIVRDQVQQAIVSAWATLEASRHRIAAAKAAVEANEAALAGTREEAKVGQRTTLDVLNAQQMLLSSRVMLITAQRDRIVASYEVLNAVGQLNHEMLGLQVARYDATQHFEQVKDKWIGTGISYDR